MAAFQAKDKLIAAAQSYYRDEQFSDFTITCEGREFKVHRCFIAPHSRFFEKACGSMFKETQERKIDLKEDDPSMVELMVQFFYTFDYTSLEHSGIAPLDLHARVHTIADKYEVLGLKSIALAKFKSKLQLYHHDGKVMIAATRALAACRPLPCCDTTLHDLVIEAWLHGGEDTFDNVEDAEIDTLYIDEGWLPRALAKRAMKGIKRNMLRGRCTNRCKSVKETDSWTMMAGIAVTCRLCHAVIGDEGTEVITVSHVRLKKSIWDEPAN